MSLKENFYDISFFVAYNSLKKSHDKLSITSQTMVRCPLIVTVFWITLYPASRVSFDLPR